MMLYRVLRRLAGVALGWYYADVMIEGREQLRSGGPVLLVANHPNALVDAMAVVVAAPRRVRLTAKATLFEQPLLAMLLRAVGVVPLRRAKDERNPAVDAAVAVGRNADAFQMVTSALAGGSAVLVFPEGVSHDASTLAPLRTGAARMALMARGAGVRALRIVAAGLVYDEKERPRSRLLVRFGEPLDLDAWLATTGGDGGEVAALMGEIDARLRQVTLNFGSERRARRAVQLARALAAVAGGVPPLDHPRPLATEADLARRIEAASEALAAAPDPVVRQADAFIAETTAFEQWLAARGVVPAELHVSPRVRHGAWFLVRESALLMLALPVALVDRVAHDIPVRMARTVARRSLATDPSRDQPAMRTIVIAAVMLLAWYLALGIVLGRWVGAGIALLVVATMALSASAAPALSDRLTRAWQRARTYLALRADPAFHASALAEAERLLEEARRLERTLLERDERAIRR